ncbi:photosynthetic reaction center subunit H [Rivibacter subsaxonicus]|uniref:Photosynthetic reaction center H subunit n=1 Tax=Rivibacter subsaxonicus TaxID=457575 RepID=A0A4Q7W175_9BURK|nr:photosynthetic reaction center subunit H [Rivibacter subsaxonicus]RZU02870.1 photosynthetic reaction center H subunit [Rivibacter subsaxonicus]
MSTATGAITAYIDVAQIALYLFWVFFAGLIYYLHRENKREGYPLEAEGTAGRTWSQGFPAVPRPKSYLLADGSTVTAPHGRVSLQPLAAVPSGNFPGAPLDPIGDPLLAGVGPGSWTERADIVELTFEGKNKIVPLRVAPGFGVAEGDRDPRGLPVVGADGRVAGTVRELWVDRSEALFRYIELNLPNAAHGPQVLLPLNFARIEQRRVVVNALLGAQLANVPRTRHPDQVTRLEEEKIVAYYGAGTLYATPQRKEPLL